jgi:ATPase subunit of ABC transporter with duplicated ATPase domains
MRLRKRTAQVSAGKYTATHEDRLDDARGRLEEAETQVREVPEIRVDLPDTQVPPTRTVLETHGLVLRTGRTVELAVDGPERIAVVGPNGSGKTTLLHTLAGRLAPAAGAVDVRVPSRLLPQRLDLLDDDLGVAENVARFAPDADTNAVRARLARFRFRGAAAERPVGTLSGGERFRATLAALLLGEPAPLLLLLDEPTNNLDFASLRQLVTALEGYRGALLVASHDEEFLAELGITRTVSLGG